MSRRPGSSGSEMAKGMSQASYGLSVALGFVAVVLACWFLGRLLDEWLGTEPWIQVAGAIGGWVLGVVLVIYASKKIEREVREEIERERLGVNTEWRR